MLCVGDKLLGNDDRNIFDVDDLKALQEFYAAGKPYFQLINNGVKFKQYVGVLQVGNLTIEVLPKIDEKNGTDDPAKWQGVLIDMLRSVGGLKIHAPTSANLQLKSYSILELYIELFLQETAQLLHRGLVKQYRKTADNQKALKGSLQFARHITQNIVHAERFYVRYTTYDKDNALNRILLKTLKLIRYITTNPILLGQAQSQVIDFPELDDLKVLDNTFDRIVYNRKTEAYRNAIEIGRLLLLNYHPDVQQGNRDVLALLFDMNKLWEAYVFRQLQKHCPAGWKISAQNEYLFWKTAGDNKNKNVKPDIVLRKDHEVLCIDTKWKVPDELIPSDDDLKQMFVYNALLKGKSKTQLDIHSILLYPGLKEAHLYGRYAPFNSGTCSAQGICILDDNGNLNSEVFKNYWTDLMAHQEKFSV